MLTQIQDIFSHLGDELSRDVFLKRVEYGISGGDRSYIRGIAETILTVKSMFDWLEKQEKIVVYGAGYRGRQLVDYYCCFGWCCFIDKEPKEKSIKGYPVFQENEFWAKYDGQSFVISSRIYANEMLECLVEHGVPTEKILKYGQILDDLLAAQYFDLPELCLNEELFVDVGCWDAYSSEGLYRKIGKGLKKIFAFEPDKVQYAICKRTFQNIPCESILFDKGAWSEDGVLKFGINGSMLQANEGGDMMIPVTTIDSAIGNAQVSFVKMDIEGAELEALKGCEKLIRTLHPKLAICVYHKLEDIFTIPQLILDFYSGYTLYIRHYSPFDVETVLYAVPKLED